MADEYRPGIIAGIPFPTTNVTPGNKIFDLGDQIPFTWIPWGETNQVSVGSSTSTMPVTGIPGGTSNLYDPNFPQASQKFLRWWAEQGVPAGDWAALRAKRLGSKRGGRISKKAIERARLRTLMRARKR